MPKVKAWKEGSEGEPDFPSSFEVLKKAVLQVTDIKTNRNKYYAIELHQAKEPAESAYRVFTHYGRTDDLDTNPNAGVRESRYHATAVDAEANYTQIYKQKTSPRKGYKEVHLASSRIGSTAARGTSSGHVDAKTLEKMEGKKGQPKPKIKASRLPLPVQDLVTYLYEEATQALTSTVNAKITANGIETPLGILTIGQIDRGQAILDQAFEVYGQYAKASSKKARYHEALTDLTGEFYSAIPHRLGRTRKAVEAAVIDSVKGLQAKQETLQLMRDMLAVDGDGSSVLFDPEIDKKYDALRCEIEDLPARTSAFKEMRDYVESSQVKTKHLKVKALYRIKRPAEREVFDAKVGNEKLLMHGSQPKNWVGILSRGILMPKTVVSLGVRRTDAGWLGNGIYFGNAACTSLYYAQPGKRGTRFMTVARVGLGKVKKYRKITYGLEGPPSGYDSCHGERQTRLRKSQFEDDEFVIYRQEQQQLEYLVEFKG